MLCTSVHLHPCLFFVRPKFCSLSRKDTSLIRTKSSDSKGVLIRGGLLYFVFTCFDVHDSFINYTDPAMKLRFPCLPIEQQTAAGSSVNSVNTFCLVVAVRLTPGGTALPEVHISRHADRGVVVSDNRELGNWNNEIYIRYYLLDI